MIHWTSRKPDPEDIEIDAYWDELVQLEPGRPVPIPPPPTELTSLIHQLTLGQHGSFDRPDAGDPMLLRVLKRQQEITTMNQAMSLNTPIPSSTELPVESRREKWTSLGLIAAVFALAIGLVALNLGREGPSNSPAGIVLTGDATPESPTPSATDYLNRGASLVWRTESGAEAMIYPTDITIGPDGNIWVAEAGRNQIRIYSPEGDVIETWGEPGSGPGQFNFQREPHALDGSIGALAFAQDGSFYVVDSANHRVQKFDRDRNFVLEFGTRGGGNGQFAEPSSVAIGPDGTVYVQDFQRDLIQAFDADGTFLRRIGKRGDGAVEFSNTGWISVAPNGTLWSADWQNFRIMNFTTDGNLIAGWGTHGGGPAQFDEIIDVIADGEGRIYTSEMANHRVQIFNPDGQLLTVISDMEGAGFMVPAATALDGSGNLYIADFGRGLVLKYQIDFDALTPGITMESRMNPTDAGSPSVIEANGGTADFLWTSADSATPNGPGASITVAPNGNVWMADAGSDTFRIYSPQGNFLEEWGTAGAGSGEFDFVEDRFATDLFQRAGEVLFLDDGTFLVADPGNGRVQIFSSERIYIGEFGSGPDLDAIVESIGPLFDLGGGEVGVVEFPGEYAGEFELVVFTMDGTFVERRPVLGGYLLYVDGDTGYWSMSEPKNLPRKYSWDGDVLIDLEEKSNGDQILGIAADMAIDATGTIFTADLWTGTISAFAPDGTYLMSWNGEDNTIGMFWSPGSIGLADDGTVIVLDLLSLNVSAYRVTFP